MRFVPAAVRAVSRGLAVIAGIALLAMMLLTFVDVIGRYGLNNSIFGTAEYVELLMTVAIFAGLALVTASDNHIKVELFERFPPPPPGCPVSSLSAPRRADLLTRHVRHANVRFAAACA